MGNPYPIRIQGSDGIATLNGEATFTDPANQPGGGGSVPHAREIIASTGPLTLLNGGSSSIALAHSSGDALLDYTTPAAPTVVADGTYVFSFAVYCATGSQVSGAFSVGVTIDGTGQAVSTFPLNVPGNVGEGTATLAVFMTAGLSVSCYIANFSGIGSLDFDLDVSSVQRIG